MQGDGDAVPSLCLLLHKKTDACLLTSALRAADYSGVWIKLPSHIKNLVKAVARIAATALS